MASARAPPHHERAAAAGLDHVRKGRDVVPVLRPVLVLAYGQHVQPHARRVVGGRQEVEHAREEQLQAVAPRM